MEKERMRAYVILGAVTILLLVSVVQAVKMNKLESNFESEIGSSAVGSGSASSQGETYEQMMARMHPDQVVAPSAPNAGPSMVGGC